MRNRTVIMVLGAFLLLPPPAHSGQPKVDQPGNGGFIQTNTWWNLYFAKDNNPLLRGNSSISAVKVLEVDPKRPSWIKISFPKSQEEHFSIFGPAATARDDDNVKIAKALAEWEKTISEWKVMWVNLDYVVSATRVASDGPANGSQPIRSETNRTSPPAGSRR